MQTLIGKNGAMVGSAPYFQKLNEGTIIGDLMRSCFGTANSTNYAGLYDKLKAKSDDAVEEIFWDLKKYVGVMRHFPKDDRDNLVAFIKALEELKGFGNQGSISKASSCIDILTLNSYDTKPQSRADLRDIEAAAKRASQKNRSTALELVKRAADYGIPMAAGSDSWKLAFLHDTIGPYSQDFYKDLYIYMDFQKNHRYMRGKCYKELCTPEYVAEMEKEVFGNAAGQFSGSYSYYAVFLNGLKEIAAELEADLDTPIQGVQTEYQETLKSVAGQLDKFLGTKLKGKAESKHLMYKDSQITNIDPLHITDKSISRDYIFLSRQDYYFENERDYGDDQFFVEYMGVRYPTLSKETVLITEWDKVDLDFLNDTLDILIEEANKSGVENPYPSVFTRMLNESISSDNHTGDLDFKKHLSIDSLYLVNGVVYNRNEAGNFVWTYYLEEHGIKPGISGSLAQAGSILGGEHRFDESWDRQARYEGTKYWYVRQGREDEFHELYDWLVYKP